MFVGQLKLKAGPRLGRNVGRAPYRPAFTQIGDVTFTKIGPVELKGVPGTLRLYIARRDA
jgi:hypothetical protein